MKKMIRMITLLFMLFLLVTGAAAESAGDGFLLQLPADLTAIEQEAFLNNASLQQVVIPEGAKSIGPRAFANSSAVAITLPRSLERIAEDAFDGCHSLQLYVWRNSYAHRWCAMRNIPYTVIDMETEQEANLIHSVTVDTSSAPVFLANISTATACKLQVEILSDAETPVSLFFSTANVPSDLAYEEVSVPAASSLPTYYLLRAVLLDANGKPLCDPYVTRIYTQAYHQFQEQTPSDFPQARVLDFGSSGYAVLAENVKRTGAAARTVADGRYVLTSSQPLSAGDVIHFTVDGQSTVIKVAALTTNADGSVTVSENDDVTLSEMYDTVYIDAYMTDPTAARTNEPIDDAFTVFDDTYSLDFGAAHISANISLKIHSIFAYDKKLWGPDYYLAEVYVESDGKIDFTLGGEIDTWKENSSPRILIYKGVVVIPGINLPAFLDVSVPCNIKAQAGGSAWFGFTNKSGFSYTSDEGWKPIQSKHSEAHAEIDGEFEISVGPQIALYETLFDKVEARLSGQIGLRANGVLEAPQYGGSTAPVGDSIHACLACIKIDPSVFLDFRASLVYDISKKVSGTLLDKKIASGETDLGDMHFSLINEPESIYGGNPKFGTGLCPNLKYRVAVHTYDMNSNELSSIPLTLTGDKTAQLNALSPAAAYLYPGDYKASADINANIWDTDFTVKDEPELVVVQEEETIVSGTVTSSRNASLIAGASVSITLPDGTLRTAITDVNGQYRIGKLPGGTFTISFSADNHEAAVISNLTFIPGSKQNLSMELTALVILPLITAETYEIGTVQALTAEGTCPEGVPKVEITIVKGRYFPEKVVITHEACASSLSYTPEIMFDGISFFGVDMGNGEYTFVIQLANTGTGGGYDILVFREKNGKLEVIKKFLYEDYTDNIRIDASFSSEYDFSGVIYPSKTPVIGSLNSAWDFDSRIGCNLSDCALGSMYYEEQENETYDLIFTTSEYCLGRWDSIGGTYTRYVMKDNALIIDSQWYEVFDGIVTTGGAPS